MKNKIIVKGLKVYSYHGVNDFERKDGQTFVVDCILSLGKNDAFQSDDLKDTVNFAHVVKSITKTVYSGPHNLIERVAENIARDLIFQWDKIKKIEVTVKKPQAPINAEFDYVAVKISRKRRDFV